MPFHRTLVIVTACCLGLAGCGEPDRADIPGIEREIETWAAEQIGETVTVDCPSEIEWRTGGDFRCVMEDRQGTTAKVTVYMENDAGDYTWEVG